MPSIFCLRSQTVYMTGQGTRSTTLQVTPSWKGLGWATNITSPRDRVAIQRDHDNWKSETTGNLKFRLFGEEHGQGRIINLYVQLWILSQVWPLWKSSWGYSNTLWKHHSASMLTVGQKRKSSFKACQEREKKASKHNATVQICMRFYLELYMCFGSWLWRRL